MSDLREKDHIDILMVIGYDDSVRTQDKACNIFNDLYCERNIVSRSMVTKTLRRFNATGMVKKSNS